MHDLVDELQRTRQVSDATYAAAVGALGEERVVEAVATAGYYTTLAMTMNAAGTPPPDDAPRLPARDGPVSTPVVLLHPLGVDHRFWDPVRAVLPEGLGPVVAPDLLGHGKAPLPRAGRAASRSSPTPSRTAAARTTPARCTWSGVSLGALVAQVVAARSPRRWSSASCWPTASRSTRSTMRSMWRERAAAGARRGPDAVVEPMETLWFSPASARTRSSEVADGSGAAAGRRTPRATRAPARRWPPPTPPPWSPPSRAAPSSPAGDDAPPFRRPRTGSRSSWPRRPTCLAQRWRPRDGDEHPAEFAGAARRLPGRDGHQDLSRRRPRSRTRRTAT